MSDCDILIRDVQIFDGSGGEPQPGDVAIANGRVLSVGNLQNYSATKTFDGAGKALAPGFIDVHTHDDLYAISSPEMLPKLSQGVTTAIVGNCGISASPVHLNHGLAAPMNLLGEASSFCYPTFEKYAAALTAAQPAINVAALIGHTALRNNHMDRLDRIATTEEISAMRRQLSEALDHGALGLSTGLAYQSANAASTEEVLALAEPLARAGAIYTTHMRTEAEFVLEAMEEAFRVGHQAKVPLVISHLKCFGIDNWGRSGKVLQSLNAVTGKQTVGWDCYPYAASSTVLDARQIDERVTIVVTWSTPHPEMAGKTLAQIAQTWKLTQMEAAKRLQPAGAIYHSMSEDDVREILKHSGTMIGSDGLPNDSFPHPRLWGTFPRVLGFYSREQKLFSLGEAVRKMTSLPAQRFGLTHRGWIREGYSADLVFFDPDTVGDAATFEDPKQPAVGIEAVWVNGVLSYRDRKCVGRAGKFLARSSR